MRLTRSSRGSVGKHPTGRPSRTAANRGRSISSNSNSSSRSSSSRAGRGRGRSNLRTSTRGSRRKPSSSNSSGGSSSSKHNHILRTSKASSDGVRGLSANAAVPASDSRCTRSSSKSSSTLPVTASRRSTRNAAARPSGAAAAAAAAAAVSAAAGKLSKNDLKEPQEANVLPSEARRRAPAPAPPAPAAAVPAAAAAAPAAAACSDEVKARPRRGSGAAPAVLPTPGASSPPDDALKRVPHQLLKYVRLDARRVSLFGVRDAKQIEGLGKFLLQQFASGSPAAAVAGAAAGPRLGSTARQKADKRASNDLRSSSKGDVSAAARGGEPPPARRKGNQEDKQQHQQQQQQQLEEDKFFSSEEESDSDGEGWDEEATDTTVSLCVSDVQQEPFVSLLQQLQQQGNALRLRHLQLDLIGVEWDNKVVALLRSVLQQNAGSLQHVCLRCGLPSAALASLLQAIPPSVRALNISENTVEADAVEQLRQVLQRGYLRCLRISNAGLSLDCQRGIVSALETAGCHSSLIWLEACSLQQRGCGDEEAGSSVSAGLLATVSSSNKGSDSKQASLKLRLSLSVFFLNPHAVLIKNFCFLRYLRLRALAASLVGRRLRVWWHPTDDAARSDFAGRFWPCSVLQHDPSSLVLRVVYDNGEEDFVPLANLQPLHPFAFGGGWMEQQQHDELHQQQQEQQQQQQQEEQVVENARKRAPPQQMRRPQSKRQMQLQEKQREENSSAAAEALAAGSSSSSRSNSCEPLKADHLCMAAHPVASMSGIKARARPQRQPQQKQQQPAQQRLQPRRTRRQQGSSLVNEESSSAVAAAAAAAAATTSSCCSRCGNPQSIGYSSSLPLPEGMRAAAKAFPLLLERELRSFRPLGISPDSSSSSESRGTSTSVIQSRDDAAAAAAAVEAAPVPLEALGNVLLPGELCEYRDEEEHKGSDPCDYVGTLALCPAKRLLGLCTATLLLSSSVIFFVFSCNQCLLPRIICGSGLVTKVFSEEPLYELRCIYQEGSERLWLNAPNPCLFLVSPCYCVAAAPPGSSSLPPRKGFQVLFPSPLSWLPSKPSRPFPTYRLISPLQPQQLDDPPVSSSLFEAKLLEPKAFASLYFEKQQAALRCLLKSPEARGLYVHPEDVETPSHDANGSGVVSSSSSSEGSSDSSNSEGYEKTSAKERLLCQVVHPRLQLLLGARFLKLLKREQLVQRLLMLQRETELLREQQQRQLTLASECRSLRERAERQQQLQQEAESRLLCLLCVDRKRRVVLLPCAHFYLCSACSAGVGVCPLCRAPITRRLLVKREDDDPQDK
ncbi:hypothetical protein Emed_005556 [Eimeria media]